MKRSEETVDDSKAHEPADYEIDPRMKDLARRLGELIGRVLGELQSETSQNNDST